MDRREFLTARKRPTRVEEDILPGLREINSDLTPYSGPWTTQEITHLLKRTMFGAAKADVEYFKPKSLNDAVNELLNVPLAPASPPLKNYDDTNIVYF